MSIFGKLVGLDVGNLADKVIDIVDKFVETDEEKQATKLLRQKMVDNRDALQAEINKIEAGHRTLFVAGWRPAVGWVCVAALAWGWMIQPTIVTILRISGVEVELPAIDVDSSMTLIMSLLGMGALRTYEKTKK